jgi:hypothetical protein
MDADSFAAAALAAALIGDERVPNPANLSVTDLAARIYFDCLAAIPAERARRHQVRSERSRM